MQTTKLYYEDQYTHTFTAKIIAKKPDWIALAKTAFYPEGGGQPGDSGWLQDEIVTDTQIDDNGLIWHRTALQGEIGESVEGRLDWLRRFDHMQQHTAQHVLSQAFWQLSQAETVGFHLGEQVSTIDLTGVTLDAEAIQQAEALANSMLRSKLLVRSRQVEAASLPAAELRKLPQVEHDIRLLEIENFDLCPCGGTHVCDLGEIGLLKILGSENKRGDVRVSFLAGHRAYRDYAAKHNWLTDMSVLLSEPVENVSAAVERLQIKLIELERAHNHLREQKLMLEAPRLLAEAEAVAGTVYVVQELREHSLDDAKFLASHLTEGVEVVVVFGLPGDPYRLVAAAHVDAQLAVGKVLREILARHDGRGGGTSTAAQGAVASADGAAVLAELAAAYQAEMKANSVT